MRKMRMWKQTGIRKSTRLDRMFSAKKPGPRGKGKRRYYETRRNRSDRDHSRL